MINCSIHNYQEWIGAYMEGSLSREDMLTAESFLQQHPHIMDQYLEELETFSLEPASIDPPSFSGLEIVITSTTHINQNNFSDYFISYHEGLLSHEEKKQVDEFIQLNPVLKKEFGIYAVARLQADNSIEYPDKKALYKKSRPVIPLFGRIAAAASVLLVVGLYILWPSNDQKNGIALQNSSGVNIPLVVSNGNNLIDNDGSSNPIWANNKSNGKRNDHPEKNSQLVKSHHNSKIEMIVNMPVHIERATPSVEDLQPEMALQEVKPVIIIDRIDKEELAEDKPNKKGLFNKLFSGEKTYIEDYVNATFTAFNNGEEDNKWVLKVDRDKKGKSRRVKFSSPIFSAKSAN